MRHGRIEHVRQFAKFTARRSGSAVRASLREYASESAVALARGVEFRRFSVELIIEMSVRPRTLAAVLALLLLAGLVLSAIVSIAGVCLLT